MTTNDYPTGELVPGCPIYTSDGDEIGKVKELRDEHFKVDAPMRPDYWLPRSVVAATTFEAVTLTVDTQQLDARMIGEPQIDAATNWTGSQAAEPEPADANEMAAPAGEGLLAGEPQPGSWGGAWSVPVGAAWDQVVANYQIDWRDENGQDRSRWAEAEPGLRYGHEMAMEGRYAGLAWGEAVPELGRGYPEWTRQQGYADGESSWERDRENARRSWERQRQGDAPADTQGGTPH